MAKRVSAFSLRFLLVSAVALFPLLLQAQDTMAKSDKKSMSKETVTGCLQKGDEANGYTLTGDDGKVWELTSSKVKLADHVGHKVTVSGSSSMGSAAMEKKMEGSETKEAAGKDHADLKVATLKMVSDSCK